MRTGFGTILPEVTMSDAITMSLYPSQRIRAIPSRA
jgi:hypothetical protein